MAEQKNETQYNVFISWSGNRSKHVAAALRDWLPMVLQAAHPFMSATDIDKGSRGLVELATALEGMKVGIICLTPENLSAKWILFEAGALSKTLDKGTRVCTYLLAGLRPEGVERPLGEFQATKAEKEETLRMLKDINKSLGYTITDATLSGVFEALWPKLHQQLSTLPEPDADVPPERKLEDMVGEILEFERAAAQRRQAAQIFDRYLPMLEMLMRTMEANIPAWASAAAPVGASGAPANALRARLDGTLVDTPETKFGLPKPLRSADEDK